MFFKFIHLKISIKDVLLVQICLCGEGNLFRKAWSAFLCLHASPVCHRIAHRHVTQGNAMNEPFR